MNSGTQQVKQLCCANHKICFYRKTSIEALEAYVIILRSPEQFYGRIIWYNYDVFT